MAGKQVTYGCTALLGTNKKGVLKPDADGYYTVTVGRLYFTHQDLLAAEHPHPMHYSKSVSKATQDRFITVPDKLRSLMRLPHSTGTMPTNHGPKKARW